MISKVLGSAVVAACLAMSGSVFAQGHNDHQNDQHNTPARHSAQNDQHGHGASNDQHGHGDPHNQHGYNHARPAPPPRNMYAHGHEDHMRGAGPQHSFYKGGRLPPQYRRRDYVIDNWRAYHLYAPPRGYYWVQTGSDFVLAAIASGLIAQVILNN